MYIPNKTFILYLAAMLKKDVKHQIMMLLHKFTRFTKQQKTFVLYLFGLAFLLIFLPIMTIKPVSDDGYSIWLLNGHFFMTMLIVVLSLAMLFGWNMSFRFKNIIINYFGFKENDSLINFALLWIIVTAFFAIGNTIGVINDVTSTITLSKVYYFTWLYLLAGLILTLVSVIKHAKEHSGKTKIINVVDEGALKDISNRKSLKGLFDHESPEEE